jgi:hypothetical protein
MELVICVGVVGLTLLSAHLSARQPASGAAEVEGSDLIFWSETIDVWIPASLVALANRGGLRGSIPDHEQLKRTLEREGDEGQWYALLVRTHQSSGRSEDLFFVRRPYTDPAHYAEFLDVLEAADDHGRRDAAVDSAMPSPHILSEEMKPDDLLKLKAELLRISGE